MNPLSLTSTRTPSSIAGTKSSSDRTSRGSFTDTRTLTHNSPVSLPLTYLFPIPTPTTFVFSINSCSLGGLHDSDLTQFIRKRRTGHRGPFSKRHAQRAHTETIVCHFSTVVKGYCGVLLEGRLWRGSVLLIWDHAKGSQRSLHLSMKVSMEASRVKNLIHTTLGSRDDIGRAVVGSRGVVVRRPDQGGSNSEIDVVTEPVRRGRIRCRDGVLELQS